jgi:hypothetical protein
VKLVFAKMSAPRETKQLQGFPKGIFPFGLPSSWSLDKDRRKGGGMEVRSKIPRWEAKKKKDRGWKSKKSDEGISLSDAEIATSTCVGSQGKRFYPHCFKSKPHSIVAPARECTA